MSSSGCDGGQTWEDAEGEFFSEAFLNNKTATTSSMVSLSTEDDLATIAENSNGAVPGATSSLLSKASSRYISRAPLKNPDVANLQLASSGPGGLPGGTEKSSRSSRMMRPSVQGLVIEEEEELGRRGSANSTAIYYERGKRRKSSSEYAQYDNFLNENVLTPQKLWENTLQLREACLPLKFKRRIKRQYQKQPVLKQDVCSNTFVFRRAYHAFKEFARIFWLRMGRVSRPADCIYRRSGSVFASLVFLHKKFAIVGAAVLLVTYATHFLHCCNLCFTIDPAPKLYINATPEEKLVAAGSQIEDALILAQGPLRDHYLFMGQPANALAFGVAILALYAVYVARFVRLLRRRFFQLDSTSVFRDVFSSVPLARAVRPMETDRHWGNLPQVKGRMSRRWAKSSRWSIAYELTATTIVITALLVVIHVVHFRATVESFHAELFTRLLPSASAYYLFVVAAYFACEYFVPPVLMAASNCLSSQDSERKTVLHVGRVFLVWTAFYAVLIFAVVRDFPSTWKNVLRVHLFLFAAVDLAAVALKAVLAYAPSGVSSGFRLALHRSRLLNEFAAHEKVAGFARDVFLLLISALLYPVLGALVVSKHALAYAVFVLSTGEHATNSPADTFYPSNVEFLESCLTFFQITFAVLVNAVIILPSVRPCLDIASLFAEYRSRLTPAAVASSPTAAALTSSAALNALLVGAIAVLALLLFRGRIIRGRLQKENRFLRSHLEEIVRDKNYQIVKQKQWYPNCKCHAHRGRGGQAAVAPAVVAAPGSSSATPIVAAVPVDQKRTSVASMNYHRKSHR